MSYRADKQMIDTHTQTLTDTQTGAMTIPEGQNWPRVKTALRLAKSLVFFDLRVNNRDAGDLRRHGAHYDAIAMV